MGLISGACCTVGQIPYYDYRGLHDYWICSCLRPPPPPLPAAANVISFRNPDGGEGGRQERESMHSLLLLLPRLPPVLPHSVSQREARSFLRFLFISSAADSLERPSSVVEQHAHHLDSVSGIF